MSKYLEYFEGAFDSTVADKMKPENKPYVAYSKIDGVVYTANVVIPNYLCLEPLEENNQLALFKLGEFSNIKYSFDKNNWNDFPVNVDFANPAYITVDKPIYLRGNNPNGVFNMNEGQGCKLVSLGRYNVSGDITTLLNEVGNVRDLTPYGTYGVFSNLFGEMGIPCVDIVDASKLILPATTLAEKCYDRMFFGCTSLVTAPELPATTLANYCYQDMFYGCTSLTTAPELPATILAEGCYYDMFNGCTFLVAPELPATTLAEMCYQFMFSGCTSLTIAPELPATELAENCYAGMFKDCTSLNYIKCLATNISASYCTISWVDSVSSTGTFVKHPDMNDWTTGSSGIPSGWTIENAEL